MIPNSNPTVCQFVFSLRPVCFLDTVMLPDLRHLALTTNNILMVTAYQSAPVHIHVGINDVNIL